MPPLMLLVQPKPLCHRYGNPEGAPQCWVKLMAALGAGSHCVTPRTIYKAVQPCCKPLMPTGLVQSQGQPHLVMSSLGPRRVTRDSHPAQLRTSPLVQQTGPRNKEPTAGEAVLPASWACLFWLFLGTMAKPRMPVRCWQRVANPLPQGELMPQPQHLGCS